MRIRDGERPSARSGAIQDKNLPSQHASACPSHVQGDLLAVEPGGGTDELDDQPALVGESIFYLHVQLDEVDDQQVVGRIELHLAKPVPMAQQVAFGIFVEGKVRSLHSAPPCAS